MTDMEDQLRQGERNPEFLYETLKAYLMLGDPDHYDPETVQSWVQLHWRQSLSRQVSNEQRMELEHHLEALLKNLPSPLPTPLYGQLITSTRTALERIPLAKRVYGRIRLARTSQAVPEFRIADAGGREVATAFVRLSLIHI
mgnify:CR=1 FL=1